MQALDHASVAETGGSHCPRRLPDPDDPEQLKTYYERHYHDCHTWYRRRPLSGAFTHPPCMVYPPGEEYTLRVRRPNVAVHQKRGDCNYKFKAEIDKPITSFVVQRFRASGNRQRRASCPAKVNLINTDPTLICCSCVTSISSSVSVNT